MSPRPPVPDFDYPPMSIGRRLRVGASLFWFAARTGRHEVVEAHMRGLAQGIKCGTDVYMHVASPTATDDAEQASAILGIGMNVGRYLAGGGA